MHRRTLALTSASAIVAAMTVLPSISASAAEPLIDGAQPSVGATEDR